MLSGNDDGRDALNAAVRGVLDGYLGLAVWTQPGQLAAFPHLRKAAGKPVAGSAVTIDEAYTEISAWLKGGGPHA